MFRRTFTKITKFLTSQYTYCVPGKENQKFKITYCQLKLFDNTIVPVLTYGCEIWGFEYFSIIEQIHGDFVKYILHVKKVPLM